MILTRQRYADYRLKVPGTLFRHNFMIASRPAQRRD